jgi:hypothetical protein
MCVMLPTRLSVRTNPAPARGQDEVELGVEGAALVARSLEGRDQRLLHPENRVRVQVVAVPIEHMRGQGIETRCGDQEMDMGWAPGVPANEV